MAKDRRGELLRSTTRNGIDFVEIASQDQKTLVVHFLNPVVVAGTFQTKDVSISGGESIPVVSVLPVNHATAWSVDNDGNPLLTLKTASAGDFSTYTLSINSPVLDLYFSKALFSFKALCESSLDCRQPAPECPGLDGELPPIDYLAKDFLSFRKALSDFSALRYPDWRERSEADLGVMMMELLAATADELSYYQDRIQTEAFLETATQRRSLVRHARLVDYEPRPATVAQVMLQFHMTAPGPVPAGLLLSASSPDGQPIYFETGTGLKDAGSYPARPEWNNLTPYYFDDSERCLKAGATSMWVENHGLNFLPGQLLLIETAGLSTADAPLRQTVRLLEKNQSVEETDAIFSKAVTHIFWRPEDALVRDHDLTRTVVKGNLVPATQGRRFTESFAITKAPAAAPDTPLAVYRTGSNSSPSYQYTLARTVSSPLLTSPAQAANTGLAWLPSPVANGLPAPEIALLEQRPGNPPRKWSWVRWLLDAGAFDPAFTIDPARYSRVAINTDRTVQLDYDGDGADTVRFGDGVFGDIPEQEAVFTVTYRAGGGRAGNVAADTVWRLESAAAADAVTNPFAGAGGADPEPRLSIERQAPQAFRATQFRAVLKEDYQAAAERLEWVQRAGTSFRWTGSWTTVFTTPDPKGSVTLAVDHAVELIELLNRYRLAGYESYVPPPRYAALDLKIRLCARADAFRGDVQAAVLKALSTQRFADGSTGFFHPDNFTFGQALERSALEARIQSATGVGGVISIEYRRRGLTKGFQALPIQLPAGGNEIFLVDNDPSRPERGSLNVKVEGGK